MQVQSIFNLDKIITAGNQIVGFTESIIYIKTNQFLHSLTRNGPQAVTTYELNANTLSSLQKIEFNTLV